MAAGATAATEVTSVAGTAAVTPRSAPRPRGERVPSKGCRRPAEPRPVVSRRDVVRGLSCLHRKVRGQFLGGRRPAMASGYPTLGGHTVSQAIITAVIGAMASIIAAILGYRGKIGRAHV